MACAMRSLLELYRCGISIALLNQSLDLIVPLLARYSVG